MRLRSGHLLVEALCALALAGLLAAVAALSLGAARRSLHAAERRDRAERAERDAVAILREALAAGDNLVLRGDTAVDVDLLLGVSARCGGDGRILLLPTERGDSSVTAMPQVPSADDLVALRYDGAEEDWWFGVIDSVGQRSVVGQCDLSSGWQSAASPPWRLVLREPMPAELAVGAAVRVARRARFMLYHAGAGDWMLGMRRCHPWLELCGVAQPIAGPLRTPAAGGLRFVLRTGPPRLEVRAIGANGGRGASAVLPWGADASSP